MFVQRCRFGIKTVLKISQKRLFIKVNLSSKNGGKKNPLAGICHMRVTNDKTDNLRQVCDIVEMARKECVDFLFIPECCDFIGGNRKEVLELAEPLSGRTVEAYKEFARKSKMWISFGGVQESIFDSNGEKTDKMYITNLVINSDGNIMAAYRKLHLFDVNTPKYRFMESSTVSKGNKIIAPLQTPIGKVGLLVCYDIRFPELSTILRKYGAEILTYPATIPYLTGEAHLEIMLRARAIENQCFVVAPAQIGFHNPKRESYGHAMIIDPWGKILAQCKNVDLDLAVASIDLEWLKQVRTNMPTFQHRRLDVYSLIPHNISESLDSVDMNFGGNTIPAETIFFTSKYSFAFTNILCVVPGHVLIVPKRFAKRLKDLTAEEAADLFATALNVQKMLEDFYEVNSSSVTVQDGKDSGQTVNHVHVHVMPRRKNDFTNKSEFYEKFNKHDKEQDSSCRRPVCERACEAEKYRKYFEKLFKHPVV